MTGNVDDADSGDSDNDSKDDSKDDSNNDAKRGHQNWAPQRRSTSGPHTHSAASTSRSRGATGGATSSSTAVKQAT